MQSLSLLDQCGNVHLKKWSDLPKVRHPRTERRSEASQASQPTPYPLQYYWTIVLSRTPVSAAHTFSSEDYTVRSQLLFFLPQIHLKPQKPLEKWSLTTSNLWIPDRSFCNDWSSSAIEVVEAIKNSCIDLLWNYRGKQIILSFSIGIECKIQTDSRKI